MLFRNQIVQQLENFLGAAAQTSRKLNQIYHSIAIFIEYLVHHSSLFLI